MVFRNEQDGKVKYTIGISKKDQDGNYTNASMPIQFNKDVEIADQTKITIKNAWLSFYKWEYQDKKGTTFFIKCTDFEKEMDERDLHTTTKSDPFKDFGDSIEIDPSEDLPF